MRTRTASKWLVFVTLVASLLFVPGAFGKDHGDKGKDKPTRFRGLDRNNDGKITRDEWRGNDRSFSVHDRNGDGVISGKEVKEALRAEGYDDFLDIDQDRNGRISLEEWRWDEADFERMDDDHDGSLTRREYLHTPPDDIENIDIGALGHNNLLTGNADAPDTLFRKFDLDSDGVISRTEFNADKHAFGRLDTNNDGKLLRQEFIDRCGDLERSFNLADSDQDGRVSREEWRGRKKAFGRLDANGDDHLSLVEFVGVS